MFAFKIFAQAEPSKYIATQPSFCKKFYNANIPDSISKILVPKWAAALRRQVKTTTTQLRHSLTAAKNRFINYNNRWLSIRLLSKWSIFT